MPKGYTDKDGSGDDLSISNLQLVEKLLSLGANDAIDYAEPAKGNTALHTSPDWHPNTFSLDIKKFENEQNLFEIKSIIQVGPTRLPNEQPTGRPTAQLIEESSDYVFL